MEKEKRLIDASTVLKHFDGYGFGQECDAEIILDYIAEGAPTVDAVEVVHGQWIGSGQWNHKPYRMKNKEKWQTYLCSECGHSNGRKFNDNYCPNCGAKMDGGNEDG